MRPWEAHPATPMDLVRCAVVVLRAGPGLGAEGANDQQGSHQECEAHDEGDVNMMMVFVREL
jgi:hypothetical protein